MTLYKYLPPCRIDVLQQCKVRYTPPESFNDPFEGRPSDCESRVKNETIRDLMESDFPENLRERIVDETYKVLENQFDLGLISVEWSLERIRENLVAAVQQSFEPRSGPKKGVRRMLSTLIGVLSLSEDPSNPLMWSHYADGHSGFVIGVDENHPCFSEERLGGSKGLIERLIVGWQPGMYKVKYSARRPYFGGKEFWEFNFNLTKSKHWKYEKERRVMAPLRHGEYVGSDKNNLPIVLFPLAPEAIECIIFGLRIQEGDANRLLNVVTKNAHYAHVGIYIAQLDVNTFKINLHLLNRDNIDNAWNLIQYSEN